MQLVPSPRVGDSTNRLGETEAKVTTYRDFFAKWKVAHSAEYEEEQVARSVIKRINKIRLSAYKEWRKSPAAQTIGTPSLEALETVEALEAAPVPPPSVLSPVIEKTKPSVGSSSSSGVSSSSTSQENKKNVDPPKLDDDEKPKPEDERPKPEYANARDEVKAIHYAKTGAYPTVQLLDRIEGLLVTKGRTFDDYLEVLKPHLGNAWKNPGGFLTHMARTGFGALVSPPQEMPKPKCPTCMADNQRGAILQSGAIVPCPACSNPEWRAELTAKLNRPAKKTQGASGE